MNAGVGKYGELDIQKIKNLQESFSKAIPGDVRKSIIDMYRNELGYEITKTLRSQRKPVDFHVFLDGIDKYYDTHEADFMELGREFERLQKANIINKEVRGPGDVVYSLSSHANYSYEMLQRLNKYYTQPIIDELKQDAKLEGFSEDELSDMVRIGLIVTLSGDE